MTNKLHSIILVLITLASHVKAAEQPNFVFMIADDCTYLDLVRKSSFDFSFENLPCVCGDKGTETEAIAQLGLTQHVFEGGLQAGHG